MKQYNSSTAFCHLYIFLLILSYFVGHASNLVKSFFILTGTLLTICIFLDLKKVFNKILKTFKFDIFIYLFIVFKSIGGLGFFINLSGDTLNPLLHQFFFLISIITQLIFAIFLLKSKNDLKFLRYYALLLLCSIMFSIILPNSFINMFIPLFIVFILGEVFFEAQNYS